MLDTTNKVKGASYVENGRSEKWLAGTGFAEKTMEETCEEVLSSMRSEQASRATLYQVNSRN